MIETSLPHSHPDVPDWDDFRRQMPVSERWAYLDHAAVAPLSGPAQEAIARWSLAAAADSAVPWGEWSREVEELRRLAAAAIGAQPDEIALMHNTTEGINLVSEGYPWQPGDNVVIPADEFPSNQYPWLQLAERGVEVRRVAGDGVRLDLDRLAAACDRRTRIVALSWVGYASGWRTDLDQAAQVAHACGALLLVDAIQALGVFPVDVSRTPIDFLAADGHKWLLGPEGAALFYIRREHLARLRPLGIGWHSVQGSHDFTRIDPTLKQSAQRYEGGSQNMVGMIGLRASLELLLRLGIPAVGQRIVEITNMACQWLQEYGAVVVTDRQPGHESGIVSFEWPGGDPGEVRARCLKRGVVLSARAGRLRLSAHAYNTPDDLEHLIAALRSKE